MLRVRQVALVLSISLLVASTPSIATTSIVKQSFTKGEELASEVVQPVYSYPSNNEKLVLTIPFSEPEFETRIIEDFAFTEIQMPGLISIGEPGAPSLPLKSIRILIPQNTAVAGIHVEGRVTEVTSDPSMFDLREKPVMPYQPPVPLNKPLQEFHFNHQVYQMSTVNPETVYTYVGVGYCRGYTILTVCLHPIQYNPGEGSLFFCPQMSVTVDLQATECLNPLFRGNTADAAQVQSLVINPEVLDTYIGASQADVRPVGLCNPVDSYDYVIITSEGLAYTEGQPYSWSDLLAHRQTCSNLTGTIATVDAIDQCPAYWNTTALFNDSAAHIREFIRDAYYNWDTEYILLGGDWDWDDPERQIVPERTFSVPQCPFEVDTMPSDMYFSNLDGDWYAEEHGCWGGGKGSSANDPYAEVFVGRLTVDNADHISNAIHKIIWYDLSADTTFLQKAVFFGGQLGWHITSAEYLEELRNGTDPHFYQCTGFLEWNEQNPCFAFNISTRKYADWGDMIPQSYRAVINNNDACIINHWSHGHATHALDMSIETLRNLGNTKFFFANSQQCLSGRFTVGNSTEKTLLCEKDTNGAFGLIWNTGYGWGHPQSTNGPSQFLQRQFWHYFFTVVNITEWSVGAAHHYSKDASAVYTDLPYQWTYVMYSTHLFGDPAQTLKPSRYERNVGIQSVQMPHHIKTDESTLVQTTIINTGQYDEQNVYVRFFIDGAEITSTILPLFKKQTSQTITFTWTPKTGTHTVSINLTLSGVTEDHYLDNERNQIVTVGILNQNTSELFDTLQDAHNAINTTNGHTLFVPPGTYHEHIMITKDISLSGTNRETTILESGGTDSGIITVQNTTSVQITHFTIQNGTTGVSLHTAQNTMITQNSIKNNYAGITVDTQSNNSTIFNNNFNNTINAIDTGTNNQWDNGYLYGVKPHGGNWWSNYYGKDICNGPNQNLEGPDGIGDTPYTIPEGSSLDRYPLMQAWTGRLAGTLFIDDNNTLGPWDGTPTYPYQTIQQGLNNAIPHDTLLIRTGTYYENPVVELPITLVGEDREHTIIDGRQETYTVTISGKGATVTGLTIQNSGISAGIFLFHAQDTQLISNTIRDSIKGIWVFQAVNTTITGNTIHSNTNGGIVADSSDTNYIYRNTISDNTYGVSLSSSPNSVITNNDFFHDGLIIKYSFDNRVENNTVNGKPLKYLEDAADITIEQDMGQIILINCTNITIRQQNISHTYTALELVNSDRCHIMHNTFSNTYVYCIYMISSDNNMVRGNIINQNVQFGICLWDFCNNNTISNNIIYSNTYHGIYFINSRDNTVGMNSFVNNGYGIEIRGESYSNHIYHNNFVNNSENAKDSGLNLWDNGYPSGGNYWSDYIGHDLYHGINQDEEGPDGIGDVPYPIEGGGNVDGYPLIYPVRFPLISWAAKQIDPAP